MKKLIILVFTATALIISGSAFANISCPTASAVHNAYTQGSKTVTGKGGVSFTVQFADAAKQYRFYKAQFYDEQKPNLICVYYDSKQATQPIAQVYANIAGATAANLSSAFKHSKKNVYDCAGPFSAHGKNTVTDCYVTD